ncbi:SusC/RagA family TonB-linked outer membrane protein [Pedobacter psychrophilus]|uniref:SusC/RagA family TonB-linked outer membrane protein n=1 Tax=Pedobacter psychrophilus TaxID=1826909 RepID=UPI000A853AF0|nr:SusC/RagA family TonB-linked outer membrane protein [Pedobacter psychrophilus]
MKKLVQSLFLMLLVASSVLAQDKKITGKVTAQEDGLPLPGVSVKVTGTTIGIQTDVNGNYSINFPSTAKSLEFTFIGFVGKTVNVGSTNIVNVTLATDAQTLSEVVVTAGGIEVNRKQLGNANTTVTGEVLTQAKAFNVASSLSGKVAGLQINAVSSGVNPQVRIVLRGNRSLLGNNQALVVVDNVIVPNTILGNLNPEDIEDIQVLNGAGAAALYGSDASNGALIVTTKKGKNGVSTVTFSQNTTLETVSFLPKLQKEFGSGTTPNDIPTYTPYENQQYGPRFDGSLRPIGKPLQDGSIQTVPYEYTDEKNNFWETGLTSQSDLAISSGDDKGTYYIAGQYLDQLSTVPYDRYNRFSLRVNGTRVVSPKVNINFSANYVQNRFDVSSNTGEAFGNVLQSPSQIPLTSYKNWRTDPFANPNGYYNDFFDNPYKTLEANRNANRNDYLTGNTEIKYNPIKALTLTFRIGISTRNQSSKDYSEIFKYTEYTKSISGSSKIDDNGFVNDNSSYQTQLNSDFLTQYKKSLGKDFTLNLIGGASIRDNNNNSLNVNANGLVITDLYNVGNRSQPQPNGSQSNSRTRQFGLYGDARFGFRDYLFLHVTGRNDWVSVLAPNNRSFFYPSADISFVASDAIPLLKESKVIDNLKIRGGVNKVGLVNIGAYRLLPTFGAGAGFPFANGPGFGLSAQIVAPSLTPEITVGFEGGFDLALFKNRVVTNFTYYRTNTTDQTLPVQVSSATGFTSFLTNTGEVKNQGIEAVLRVTPIQKKDFEVSVGANYTRNVNEVLSLSDGLDILNLGTFGASSVVAKPGFPFPYLRGTQYNRDNEGRIIVDAYQVILQ